MTVERITSGQEALAESILSRFKGYDIVEPEAFLADPTTLLYAALQDDQIVGWLYAFELTRPEGRREVLIYEIEVISDAQGRGHGRALVQALLAEANARGVMEIWTLTDPDNESAGNLYRRTGAESSRQVMYTWQVEAALEL